MAKTGFFQENNPVEETESSLSETVPHNPALNDDKPKSSFYAQNQEYEEVFTESGFLAACEAAQEGAEDAQAAAEAAQVAAEAAAAGAAIDADDAEASATAAAASALAAASSATNAENSAADASDDAASAASSASAASGSASSASASAIAAESSASDASTDAAAAHASALAALASADDADESETAAEAAQAGAEAALAEAEALVAGLPFNDFLDLLDTPNSYTGQAGLAVKVKMTEDGLEFGEAGAALTPWTEDVDAAGFSLTGAQDISLDGVLTVGAHTFEAGSSELTVTLENTTDMLNVVGSIGATGGSVATDYAVPGVYFGKENANNNRAIQIVTGFQHAYIDFASAGEDFSGRLIVDCSADTMSFSAAGGHFFGQDVSITGDLSLSGDINTTDTTLEFTLDTDGTPITAIKLGDVDSGNVFTASDQFGIYAATFIAPDNGNGVGFSTYYDATPSADDVIFFFDITSNNTVGFNNYGYFAHVASQVTAGDEFSYFKWQSSASGSLVNWLQIGESQDGNTMAAEVHSHDWEDFPHGWGSTLKLTADRWPALWFHGTDDDRGLIYAYDASARQFWMEEEQGGSAGSKDQFLFGFGDNTNGNIGPYIQGYRNSTSPLADDQVFVLFASGKDSGGNDTDYGSWRTEIVDPTNGNEDSRQVFRILSGGANLDALTLRGSPSTLDLGSDNAATFVVKSTSDGDAGPIIGFFHDSVDPDDSDTIGRFIFYGRNDAAEPFIAYAQFAATSSDVSDGTEDGRLDFAASVNGSLSSQLVITNGVTVGNSDWGFGTGSLALEGGLWFVETGGDIHTNDTSLSIELDADGTPLTALTLDGSTGVHILDVGSNDYGNLTIRSTVSNDAGPGLSFEVFSATPATDDLIGWINTNGKDSGGNNTTYHNINFWISDPTNGSEDCRIEFDILSGGANLPALTLGSPTSTWGSGGLNHILDWGSIDAQANLILHTTADGADRAPVIQLHADADTPEDGDYLGFLYFNGNDDEDNKAFVYSGWLGNATDVTAASIDTSLTGLVLLGGVELHALTLGGTGIEGLSHIFDLGASGQALEIRSTDAGISGPKLITYQNSASPADNDAVTEFVHYGKNDAAEDIDYVTIDAFATDVSDGTEDSSYSIALYSGGSAVEALGLNGSTGLASIFGRVLNFTDAGFDVLVGWDDSASQVKNFALADITTEATPAAGDYVLIYGAEGDLRKANWNTLPGAGGGIANVVEDTSPQLGGDLDLLAFRLIDSTLTAGHETVFYLSDDGAGFDGSANDGALGIYFNLYNTTSSPADNDQVGRLVFSMDSDTGSFIEYGRITSTALDVSDGTEDSKLEFFVQSAGSDLTALTLGVPAASEPTGDWGADGHMLDFGAADYGALYMKSSGALTGGPWIVAYHDSASPAANDDLFGISVYGNNTVNQSTYGELKWQIVDATSGSTDSKLIASVQAAGSFLNALTLGTTNFDSIFSHVFDFGSQNGVVTLQGTSAGATGVGIESFANSASPAASDTPFFIDIYGKDSAANNQHYGSIKWNIDDATSASEDSSAVIVVKAAGSSLDALSLNEATNLANNSMLVSTGDSNAAGIYVHNSSAGASGGTLVLEHDSASPAANDTTAIIFYARDSAANMQEWGEFAHVVTDATSASEDSKLQGLWERAGTEVQYTISGGIAKVWAIVTVSGGTPTMQDSENMTSISDTGTGQITFTIATDFSSANWAAHVAAQGSSTTIARGTTYNSIAAGSVIGITVDEAGSSVDPTSWSFVGHGH